MANTRRQFILGTVCASAAIFTPYLVGEFVANSLRTGLHNDFKSPVYELVQSVYLPSHVRYDQAVVLVQNWLNRGIIDRVDRDYIASGKLLSLREVINSKSHSMIRVFVDHSSVEQWEAELQRQLVQDAKTNKRPVGENRIIITDGFRLDRVLRTIS